jgi:YesN/AraC family two-component response regulator
VSGEDGLELLKKQPYDWVVVDLKMPGLGGFESIKAIKRQRPDAKITVLTGHSSSEDLDHALKLGANRYLVKPVDIEDLLDLMMQP